MAVRRDKSGTWRYRKVVRLWGGTKVRVSGTPTQNTKLAAEQAERAHIDRELRPTGHKVEQEVPTIKQWFFGDANPAVPGSTPTGRFWLEHVATNNKPSERDSKLAIYRCYLHNALGSTKLDKIRMAEVAVLKARLMKTLAPKTVNNVLSVLSKALRYAQDVELIGSVPKIGLLKYERPEIEAWSFDEYERLIAAAHAAGGTWLVAALLAGEAGLRVGEVKALRWDKVDLAGKTLTIDRQVRRGIEGTPKGGRRRVVPITSTLERALRSLSVVRVGHVVRNPDGSALRDGQASHAMKRICRKAKLTVREWHALRHTFGTHLALIGVNPFRLQAWLGHARMEETMLYVHVASAHARPLPPHVLAAGAHEPDPDRRALLMLGARVSLPATASASPWELRAPRRGNGVETNGGLLAM